MPIIKIMRQCSGKKNDNWGNLFLKIMNEGMSIKNYDLGNVHGWIFFLGSRLFMMTNIKTRKKKNNDEASSSVCFLLAKVLEQEF